MSLQLAGNSESRSRTYVFGHQAGRYEEGGGPRLCIRAGRGTTTCKQEFTLHILFVCTGNICRSPTAERLAAAYAAEEEFSDLRCSSAGTRAVVAHPIHHHAALVLQGLGGDASNFAARQLTPRICSGADLVLTMTRSHRDAVLERAPGKMQRTFTLVEAARLASERNAETIHDLAALRPSLSAGESLDIPDPIGQDADVFADVGVQIASLLPPVVELCRRSSTPTAG